MCISVYPIRMSFGNIHSINSLFCFFIEKPERDFSLHISFNAIIVLASKKAFVIVDSFSIFTIAD